MEATSVVENLLSNSPETLKEIDNTARQLIGNLLREPDNVRFQSVGAANPRISQISSSPGGSQLLQVAGFSMNGEKSRWVFVGDRSKLLAADALLSTVERRTTGAPAEVVSKAGAMQEAQRRTALEALCRDAAERRGREEERETAKQLHRSEAADFSSVDDLLPVVKLTLHNTGRIRNCSFNAFGMTLRTMAHGRSFACACPCENLEVHWHVRSTNLLYSYLYHLDPTGTSIIHSAPELGYQYNTLPGTPLFRKTVLFSRKLVVESKVECETPNTAVSHCAYCGKPFDDLWV